MARKWREVKQERADSDAWDRVTRRVAPRGTSELLEWTEVAGAGIAKGLKDYRNAADIVSLIEVRDALMVFQAITEELIERHEAGQ